MIRDRPELQPGLQLYSRAFRELSTCRAIGMGVGPIPWTFIEDWADKYGLPDDQRESLHYHITAMDNAYLEWTSKKQAKS